MQLPRNLAFSLLILAIPATAQDLRFLDASLPSNGSAYVYDASRGRIVVLGMGGDTREWDGASWTTRPFTGPAMYGAALVHDTVRNRVFAIGSTAASTSLETWSYDGTGWLRVATPTTPTPRSFPTVAFDTQRGETVLLGGYREAADTWTFDGTTWTQRFPTTSPPPRWLGAVANDSARGRVVLFGGGGFNTFYDDTWEWDGVNWLQRSGVGTPGFRPGAQLAFDPLRARCVLYGAYQPTADDVWEYNGTVWSQRVATGPVPPRRVWHGFVFDARIGEVAALGGEDGNVLNMSPRDHWSWNGTRWQARSLLGGKPPFRTSPGLVSEPGTTNVLLFGGVISRGPVNILRDTWRWDGSTWTQLPGPSPTTFSPAAVCEFQNAVFCFDTWFSPTGATGALMQWNGTTWNLVPTTSSPSARSASVMVTDLARQRIVLFGGLDSLGAVNNDTWTFDGTNWAQQFTAAPPARTNHSMAYDAARARTVLHGGGNPQFAVVLSDTWEWDGIAWARRFPATVPTTTPVARPMAYDARLQRVVMFDSDALPGPAPLVWTYDGTDWSSHAPTGGGSIQGPSLAAAPGGRGLVLASMHNLYALSTELARTFDYGNACGANPPRLVAKAAPAPGAPFGLDAIGADPSSLVAFVGATASANLPLAGCTLLVASNQLTAVALTTGAGFASLPLPLPNSTALHGVDLFFQVAALRPSAPNGFEMSRGLQIRIGD